MYLRMKKHVALILSVMIITVFSFSDLGWAASKVSAETARTKITAEEVQAVPGGTVSVDFSIEGNPGIMGMILKLQYDSDLTLVSAKNGDAFSNLTVTKPGKYENECKFVWDAEKIDEEDIKDGNILTVDFNVADNVEQGDELNVGAEIEEAVNSAMQDVNVDVKGGKVTIVRLPHEHELLSISPQSATCTEAGNYQYWYCGKCKKYFKDDLGMEEYERNAWKINATGHTFDREIADEKYLKSEADYSNPAKYYKSCHCGESSEGTEYESTFDKGEALTRKIKTGKAEAKAGETVSVDFEIEGNPGLLGMILELQYDSRLSITDAKNGDAFSGLAMTKPGEYKSGCRFLWDAETIKAEDIKDGKILTVDFLIDADAEPGEELNISAVLIDAKDSEMKKVSFVVENGKAKVDYPTHTHVLTKTAAKDATCTEDGNYQYWYCSTCNKYFKDANAKEAFEENGWIIPGGHKLTHFAEKDSTCVNEGNLEYWYCSHCKEHYKDAEATQAYGKDEWVLPLTEHHFESDYTIDTPATCLLAGTKSIHCRNCDAKQAVTEISALGHSWNQGAVTTEPTDTDEGVKTYTCTRCKTTKTETIAALGAVKESVNELVQNIAAIPKEEVTEEQKTEAISAFQEISKSNENGVGFSLQEGKSGEMAKQIEAIEQKVGKAEVVVPEESEVEEVSIIGGGLNAKTDEDGFVQKVTLKIDTVDEDTKAEALSAVPENISTENAVVMAMDLEGADKDENGQLKTPVLISFKVPDGITDPEKLIVVHKSSQGVELIKATLSEDKKTASIVVSHFSDFVIAQNTDEHHCTEVAAKAPTCTKTGNIACWYCDDCDKYFLDKEGINEIYNNGWIVKALGHKYKTVSVGNGCSYKKCIRCGAKKDFVAPSYVKSLKVKAGKKSFTVKWKKQSKKNRKKFNGYQIRYSLYSSMKSAKSVTASKSSKSKKVKKLSAKKKYYVQVRTYSKVKGYTYYSKWSSRKSVKTR